MSKLAVLGGPKAAEGLPTWPVFDQSDVDAVSNVVRSGKWFRHEGTLNETFERDFAAYHDCRFGLTTSNGTSAIEIPLYVLGIGPGDEVIVPCYTFFSTASAVHYVGATPVFCDIDIDSFNMNLDQVESLINERTKAIIPVHFAGLPVDMERLMALAKKHGLHVIEDCAHAHGAEYRGKKVGSIGDASTFSFQSSKNLSSGEGGLIATNDESLYEKMFTRHTCGRKIGKPWYEHYGLASNLRLGEIQAGLLLSQFKRLEAQTQERLANAKIVEEAIDALEPLTRVQHQPDFSTRRAYHLFMFRYAPGIKGVSRETFINALGAEGVPLFAGYPVPLYKQPVFAGVTHPQGQKPYNELYLEGAEQCCRESVWINHWALLGPEENGRKIAAALEKLVAHADQL